MKLLLSFLILFLGLVSYDAGAHQGVKEPVYPPYCWVQPNGQELWYPCGSDEAKQADCLALMETAMKAVDPFVQDTDKTRAVEEALPIKKVWDRAKNQCWSDLKDRQPQQYH